MAMNWYPVVDYLACIECGTCVNKCPHGVYDKVKAPSPLVIHPEECIDHCHGCGNRCPEGAITYVGDDTGWKPPHGKREDVEPCCCSGSNCSCEEEGTEGKVIKIDFLYLDLKTCDRCMGTDDALLGAINDVEQVLKLAGYSVELNKVEITDEVLAQQHQFVSSPTIRVNGQDISLDVKENNCGACSDISSQSVDCRLFVYEGKEYEVPPKAMIINAILRAVYGQEKAPKANEPYTMPKNIKKFLDGKKMKNTSCSCGGGCCS